MSKVLYIDESGDLGFTEGKSSNFLVITYISVDNSNSLKRLVRKLKQEQKLSKNDELKDEYLTPHIREKFLKGVVNLNNAKIGAVIIDKRKVYSNLKEKGQTNILYAYALALILLPYLVKHDKCYIYSDKRSIRVREGNMIDSYLRIRLSAKYKSSHTFSFEAKESFTMLGLQAAHIIANTIWRKYENGEMEYCEIIKSIIIDEFRPYK